MDEGAAIPELRQELARAATMLDLGRYDEASVLLARLVSAEPGSGRAWCLFARAHLGADRFAEAVEAANRAAAIEPGEEWPHRLASNALMHLGNHAEALRAAAESRRLAPAYWQTHVCVAQAALAAGQPAAAASAADEARRLAPDEPDVHFLSGKVALARGDLDGARRHQERALALDPAHSGAMNELGRIRLRRHDTVGAIRHFISAARTTPGEHIYSRNIDVVIVRSVSRMIYIFVLIAMLLLWIPAVTHTGGLPVAAGFGALALGTLASFVIMMSRLPREARLLARRTVLSRRVMAALAVALGGATIAVAAVTLVPQQELPQTLPIAIVITIAARIVATARLRAPLGPNPPGNRTSPTQPLPPTRRRLGPGTLRPHWFLDEPSAAASRRSFSEFPCYCRRHDPGNSKGIFGVILGRNLGISRGGRGRMSGGGDSVAGRRFPGEVTAAMAYEFQVTVDCAEPHVLAGWWAETLGWVVEPQDEAFIRRMIDAGHAKESDTTVHNGALVWREGAAISHPEGTTRAPRMLFQLVPEAKTVKNRVHLDLRIGTDDLQRTVADLVVRGAKFLHEGQQGPHAWVTLADPESNEFCVSGSAG